MEKMEQEPVAGAAGVRVASNERISQARHCKSYAKKKIVQAWPTIVDQLIEKASGGSYNHAKLLVEVSGIQEDETKPVRKPDTLVKILLEKLGEKERGEPAGEQMIDKRRQQRDVTGWFRERDEKGRWLGKDEKAG
jgi:hypothetical protein